jgi:hypothetical protein
MFRLRACLLGAALCGSALSASASCGAAFCLVNTDWSAQGAWMEPGMLFDFHYEFVDLDQPRSGTDRVAVGQIPRDHDEVETRNRNWVTAVSWSPAPAWGLALTLPYVDRDHVHIHNHQGERELERWKFRELGDARVTAHWEFMPAASAEAPRSAGLMFGVKLPTGRHDVTNGEGEAAERTLQPGSGTTDAIVGAYWNGAVATGWTWFARAQAVLPMNERDGFKPGRVLQVDGGVRYPLTTNVAVMLQANYQVKGRDSGDNAEPEDSGQRTVSLSPGISWNASKWAQVYAFVQLPVYQSVNGVQLTADWSALAGVSLRF